MSQRAILFFHESNGPWVQEKQERKNEPGPGTTSSRSRIGIWRRRTQTAVQNNGPKRAKKRHGAAENGLMAQGPWSGESRKRGYEVEAAGYAPEKEGGRAGGASHVAVSTRRRRRPPRLRRRRANFDGAGMPARRFPDRASLSVPDLLVTSPLSRRHPRERCRSHRK